MPLFQISLSRALKMMHEMPLMAAWRRLYISDRAEENGPVVVSGRVLNDGSIYAISENINRAFSWRGGSERNNVT